MTDWLREKNKDWELKIIIFLISPFIASLYSLRKIKTKSSFIVFFLFAIFFGLSFTVQSGKTDIAKYDGASYRKKFDIYQYVSNSEYYSNLENYFSFNEGIKDFYFDTVAFFVSRYTDNYHVMFMILAGVFAFFALKSFKFLVLEKNFNGTLACFILAYLFMSNDIFNINGVRFWTAAWIGVYSIFQIFRNENKHFYLLALTTPFLHGSFWVFLIVLFVAYFTNKKYKLWVVLFFVSFVVSNFSVEFVRGISDSLPSFLAKMVEVYTNINYIEEVASRGSGFYWVTKIFKFLVRFYMNFLVFLFIKNSKQISKNPKTTRLFSFLLIWMTFVNFTMPIPSLGGRFMVMSYPVIAYIWLINFKGVKYNRVLYVMPFVFIMSFYTKFILYKGVVDPLFFISSPVYLIFEHLINQ